MSKGKRNREKPVSTGSIALRIGLSSGLNLLLIFIVLDVVLFCVFLLPAISDGSGFAEINIDSFNTFKQLIREWKVDILLWVEGVLVVLWVFSDTLKVRSKLSPLQEFADAALKLSEMDGELEQRYQKLENAIDNLSPSEEDQNLSTGDAELAEQQLLVIASRPRQRASAVEPPGTHHAAVPNWDAAQVAYVIDAFQLYDSQPIAFQLAYNLTYYARPLRPGADKV